MNNWTLSMISLSAILVALVFPFVWKKIETARRIKHNQRLIYDPKKRGF